MASPDRDAQGNPIRGTAFFNRGGFDISAPGDSTERVDKAVKQVKGGTPVVDKNLAMTGSVNIGGMQKSFAEWEPTSDWGKMMKGTYMMNTLQAYQDSEQAKNLAFANASLQSAMMNQAAILELANKSALMDVEERAKLNVMGADFAFQSRFAQDEFNRQIGKMGFDKDIQTALMQTRGDQERLTASNTGKENRLALQTQGDQTRLTQAQANIEKMQQANLAAALQKDSQSFLSGVKKDEAGYMSGLKKDEQRFGQSLGKDTAAFQQALAKDTAGYQQGLDLEKAAYTQGLGEKTARTQSGIRKDEAAFGTGLQKDMAGYTQALGKDTAAFQQALGKDTAGYASQLRKDEAAYGQGLGKDTAAFMSGIRKDEAAFGTGLEKDVLTTKSDLAMKEADYANRLAARTRADKTRMMQQAATAF